MIYEIVDVQVDPAEADAFVEAVVSVAHLFRDAVGGRGLQTLRSLEQQGHFRILVGWDQVEDHLDLFRRSAAFETWRSVVGRFYKTSPIVEHFEIMPD